MQQQQYLQSSFVSGNSTISHCICCFWRDQLEEKASYQEDFVKQEELTDVSICLVHSAQTLGRPPEMQQALEQPWHKAVHSLTPSQKPYLCLLFLLHLWDAGGEAQSTALTLSEHNLWDQVAKRAEQNWRAAIKAEQLEKAKFQRGARGVLTPTST